MNILNIYDGAGPVPTNYYCMVSSIKLPILVTEVMQRSEKQIPNSNTGSNAHFGRMIVYFSRRSPFDPNPIASFKFENRDARRLG